MKATSLAKRIKELRTLKGMSQEFLAEESRVSLRTIQRIENEESTPTGETIKRLAIALDIEMNELVDSNSKEETNDLKGTLLFLKKQLSKTNEKSEIRTFNKFIAILSNLKEKDLSQEHLYAIESYIQYMELEKIPSYSNELFKQKLSKFKKYLKTKLRFVPNKYYTSIAISFAIPFAIGFVFPYGIAPTTLAIICIPVLFVVGIGVLLDLKIKKQGRSLGF